MDAQVPYNDGLLEAKESNQPGWVAIEWLYPGEQPWKAYRAFLKLEKLIKEQGFKGWLMASNPTHTNMHRHLMRHGGFPYALDDKWLYLKKEVA